MGNFISSLSHAALGFEPQPETCWGFSKAFAEARSAWGWHWAGYQAQHQYGLSAGRQQLRGSNEVTGETEPHRPLRKSMLMLSSICCGPALVTQSALPRLLILRCDCKCVTFFLCFMAVPSLPCCNTRIVLASFGRETWLNRFYNVLNPVGKYTESSYDIQSWNFVNPLLS